MILKYINESNGRAYAYAPTAQLKLNSRFCDRSPLPLVSTFGSIDDVMESRFM